MIYHMTAFCFGFLLDLLLGDPYFLPHPIRGIGRLIQGVEKWLRREESREAGEQERRMCKSSSQGDNGQEKRYQKELRQGMVMVVTVLVTVTAAAAAVLVLAYWINPYVGMVVETVMTYQLLAVKCLKDESMKVCRALEKQNTEEARAAVSMIVGRDTACLNEEGIIRAAVETVAENTSDGVIAPMLYTALGGPVLGFFYKAVNTMDSMIGYRNEKYLYFGRAAARLDDFVNYIPARISAWMMIAAAFLGGRSFSGKGAVAIYERDRHKHKSPNSAQTEAVCAGALRIQLAGDASYFGKVVNKPYIGDALRKAEYEDIKRANRLMYVTACMCAALCLVCMGMICLG
ncbi:MAG: cobalamin biosynthesis protein CobD [Clostridiales bacterium]|nr:cobalamin biosynthesis protein CobD [Clostridiales bacterium]